jgi:hypothetical protein
VHHRVFPGRALAEVLEDGLHICLREQLRQVVHQPGDALVQVRSGDMVEQLAKKGLVLGSR